MIVIKSTDINHPIYDTWYQEWCIIKEWIPRYKQFKLINKDHKVIFCDNTGSYAGKQRFAWEEILLPKFRPRPKKKRKIDLWIDT